MRQQRTDPAAIEAEIARIRSLAVLAHAESTPQRPHCVAGVVRLEVRRETGKE
jgi:hypothetical protein